ncbi:MAG: transcription termination/antitermination protein NusG [Pseudanabaenaceae cyanobacterium bins.68]|nr:transcription termination/antitermination protein NusG [Pseudanabaenaceae cyanobacterium bins.68]
MIMITQENPQDHLEDHLDQSVSETDAKLDSKPHWYAVQVGSGCEKKVKATLEQRILTLDAQKVDNFLRDKILQIEIPQSATIKLKPDGSRQAAQEKIFPGYVLIQMCLDDEAWQVVKNTTHVINFVGTQEKRAHGYGRGHVTPRPLSRNEIERVFRVTAEQEPIAKVDMFAGDKIKVLSGPFKDFEGEVIEVTAERSKLKASLSIFGRDTPVELEFSQVQKQN